MYIKLLLEWIFIPEQYFKTTYFAISDTEIHTLFKHTRIILPMNIPDFNFKGNEENIDFIGIDKNIKKYRTYSNLIDTFRSTKTSKSQEIKSERLRYVNDTSYKILEDSIWKFVPITFIHKLLLGGQSKKKKSH